MQAGYEKLAARLAPDADTAPETDPVKIAWARQEGFKPHYDPNADDVRWMREPKPAYQQPNTNRMLGSMSPERLQEVFPAFKVKADQIDPVLTEIAEAAIGGKITQQRAMELAYQLAIDTFGDAWKEKGGGGASKTASDFSQSLESASKSNRVAGEK
jgi:hypothetical protein